MRNSGERLKIGVKYCGGCNPQYDRVELVKKTANQLKDKADLVSAQAKDIDMGLAVQGCPTACADLSSFQGLEIVSVCSIEECEDFIQKVLTRTL